jgi:diacylglycerol kinase
VKDIAAAGVLLASVVALVIALLFLVEAHALHPSWWIVRGGR